MERQEKKLQSAVKRSRRRGAADEEEPEEVVVPSFPLVEVPDHELDEESIKEKRRQRLMKAGYDARMRVKAEKAEERRLEEEARKQDEEDRMQDPIGWAKSRRQEYEVSAGEVR